MRRIQGFGYMCFRSGHFLTPSSAPRAGETGSPEFGQARVISPTISQNAALGRGGRSPGVLLQADLAQYLLGALYGGPAGSFEVVAATFQARYEHSVHAARRRQERSSLSLPVHGASARALFDTEAHRAGQVGRGIGA
jgi:hypothetical protein